MRCLTIADALPGSERPVFLCADEQSAALVRARDYEAIVLHTDYRQMEEELPRLKELFSEAADPADRLLVVDSYYVTHRYLRALCRLGRVALLDDMGQEAFEADMVINYNAFASREHYEHLYGTGTRLLIGSSFVPVRSQFLQSEYRVREKVSHILVTTGGGDSENIAARAVRAVLKGEGAWKEGLHFHIVTGRFNRHFEELKEWERGCDRIHVYHDVQDMASLMKSCDLALTAGGTTVYELAAVGVPFVCFSYAQNQEALTEYIGREKIAGYCGAYHLHREQMLDGLAKEVEEICRDTALRERMSQRERALIDGRGAERIGKELLRKGCFGDR